MMTALIRHLCIFAVSLLCLCAWLGSGCSSRECRLDVDCTGNLLCLQGRCVTFKKGGDASIDSETLCEAGKKRPCYRGPYGSAGKGICKAGQQTCLGDRWGVCEGEILPVNESCNNEDSDCNGKVDDGKFGGTPCLVSNQKGPCERGVEACVDGKIICKQTVQAVEEKCGDGLDNDCDGEIDESPPCTCKPGTTQPCFEGKPELRNKGICKDGLQTCTPEQKWGACQNSKGPQQEICDNKDNNCNGQTDEGLKRACEAKCGQGTETCTNGQWSPCTAPTPSTETCDGKDNDCDGKTDEDLTRTCKTTCGPGTQACQVGEWTPCQGPKPSPEICDGKDNDCDGKTDEGLTRPCSNACGSGTQSCVQGKWQGCNGTAPSTEVCDNKDNDCNGKIDDNVRRTCTNTCGKGTEYCARGRWVFCSAPRPSVEICDGKDNDCNGKVDEKSAAAKRLSSNTSQSYSSLSAVWNGSYFGTFYRYQSGLYFQRWTREGRAVGSATLVKSNSVPLATQLLWTGTEFAGFWTNYKTGGFEYGLARISSLGKLISTRTLTHIKGGNTIARMAWNGTYFGLTWTDGTRNRMVRFGRLDKSGNPVGTVASVTNSTQTSLASLPDIAALKGNFGIVWYERRNNQQDIFFQQYTSTGSKLGSEINISNTSATSTYPRIAASNLNYLVAYSDNRSQGTYQLYARQVSSRGTPSSLTRKVSSRIKSVISLDLKSMGGSSLNFAATWSDSRTSPRQIWFAKLSFSGLLRSQEIQVSNTTKFTNNHTTAPITDSLVGAFWIDGSGGTGQIYFRGLCGF